MPKLVQRKLVVLGYVMTVLLPVFITCIQFYLDSFLTRTYISLFYPAIFIAARMSGKRAGWICTLVCAFLEWYYFVTPKYSYRISNVSDFISVILLLIMGWLISYWMGKLYKSEIASSRAAMLEESRGFLDSLLENIPNMVFVKDAENLRFVRFNKAGEDLIGHPREELIGKNDYAFFPKEQAEFFISKDRAVLNGRAVVDIPEEPIQTTSGIRILHTKKIPLYNDEGIPEYLLGISEDITEKKKREEERLKMIQEEAVLKEREIAEKKNSFLAEVSTLLASSLDYHQTLSKLARLLIADLCDWCTITMVTKDGDYERSAAVHTNPDLIPLLDELMERYPVDSKMDRIRHVIEQEESFFTPTVSDEFLQSSAKDERHLEILKSLGTRSCMYVPIRASGKVLGAIALVRGNNKGPYVMEDLALAEELGRRAGTAIENALLYASAQSAIRARDEFLSIASHELKTPITSLKLQLQMSQRMIHGKKGDYPSSRLENSFENSLKQINRLTMLVEDLLDVSRMEVGKLIYRFEETNLSNLAEDILERFQDQLKNVGCEVHFKAMENIMVKCDRYRIEQVIANLLTNVIKYAPSCPLTMEVTKTDEKALIVVEDKGPGIAPEMQTKIFERFERASTDRNVGGLGLGLYISRQIVLAHEGTIEVMSEPGQGTTFKVWLPLLKLAQ